jgi:hypothetical protein
MSFWYYWNPSRHFVFLYFASLILTWYLEHGLILLELFIASVVEFPKIWECIAIDLVKKSMIVVWMVASSVSLQIRFDCLCSQKILLDCSLVKKKLYWILSRVGSFYFVFGIYATGLQVGYGGYRGLPFWKWVLTKAL